MLHGLSRRSVEYRQELTAIVTRVFGHLFSLPVSVPAVLAMTENVCITLGVLLLQMRHLRPVRGRYFHATAGNGLMWRTINSQ